MWVVSQLFTALLVILILHTNALSSSDNCNLSSKRNNRRDAIKNIFLIAAGPLATLNQKNPASALEACRPKARNCIRTTWAAPPSTSKADAVQTIRTVLNSYPTTGQNGIDCNGWKFTTDSLDENSDTSTSSATLEYKSCVGPAAISINLAQPFVDDVKLEISQDGLSARVVVDVKSSSRMGSSDLFVNKKRIEYLGNELMKLGWDIPDVRYGS